VQFINLAAHLHKFPPTHRFVPFVLFWAVRGHGSHTCSPRSVVGRTFQRNVVHPSLPEVAVVAVKPGNAYICPVHIIPELVTQHSTFSVCAPHRWREAQRVSGQCWRRSQTGHRHGCAPTVHIHPETPTLTIHVPYAVLDRLAPPMATPTPADPNLT